MICNTCHGEGTVRETPSTRRNWELVHLFFDWALYLFLGPILIVMVSPVILSLLSRGIAFAWNISGMFSLEYGAESGASFFGVLIGALIALGALFVWYAAFDDRYGDDALPPWSPKRRSFDREQKWRHS